MSNSNEIEEQLSQLFGSYRAEWLKEKIFDLFSMPAYFSELTTSRPCVLVGGRGTGKTTVLRSLSYEGRYALTKDNNQVSDWPYYGIYYRANTNRVTAFKGPELNETEWCKLFAHYFNLLICEACLNFIEWYNSKTDNQVVLSKDALAKISLCFNFSPCITIKSLSESLELEKYKFEAYINNVSDDKRPRLSMQGAPIDTLFNELSTLNHFKQSTFFIIIDEYENFEDYQQQVINTLIKHVSGPYTFKIGVRELGWRKRTTLNQNEQLISPADYTRINISEVLQDELFSKFAFSVCNERLSRLTVDGDSFSPNISKMFTDLSEEEEARKLGISSALDELKRKFNNTLTPDEHSVLSKLSDLEQYFILYWSSDNISDVKKEIKQIRNDIETWRTRFDNYKHCLLYTIKTGKRGIKKYYSGWNTLVKLSASNIRYLLQLVDQSLLLHLRKQHDLLTPVDAITQTEAAISVGKKNFSELEGLSVHGGNLTRLLLGLGRVFQIFASEPRGHSPEVTQFHISDEGEIPREANEIIQAAVMHLALLRFSGSKLTDDSQTKDYDYAIHPIFSPFFVFSYRKKRKFKLSSTSLLGLIKDHKNTINSILNQNKRTSDAALPEQLFLFEAYYSGNK